MPVKNRLKMFRSAPFLKYISSLKKSLNRKKLGVVFLLIFVAGFLSWEILSGSEVDAKVLGLKARGAKFEDKKNLPPNKVTVTPSSIQPTPTPTLIASPTPISTPVTFPSPTPTATSVPTISQSTPKPTITPTTTQVDYPSQLINLTNWKLTLPIGSSEKPMEIKQPALATYKIDPWFIVSNGGVRFRAPVNGVTTSGSGYPRSELREMTSNGTSNASWSSTSGTHTMFLDQAITAVPQTKKHVVAGQIHDSGDDVIVIRLEYPNLYVNVDGKNMYTLDSNYTLGKRFTVKFVATQGQTKVYYNGAAAPSYTLDKSYSGAYFKAGAYTQSNCSREASSACTDSNFGEVIVYQVVVTH